MFMSRGIILCMVIMILTGAPTAPTAFAADEHASDERVATVNGSAITRAAFERELGRVKRRLSKMGRRLDDFQPGNIEADVLENLIDGELLYQESQRAGIEIDETTISNHLETVKSNFPSDTEYNNALRKMNISEADIVSDFKRGKAIEQLLYEKVARKIAITDEQTKGYYEANPDRFKQPEQVRASHILIKADPDADESQNDQARTEIEGIQRKLQEGGDFAALAQEFSQDSNRANGGDLGYFSRSEMTIPSFEEAAFALKPGEVSDIVETGLGYHLIKVTDRKAESTVPYDAVADRLKQYLEEQELRKQVDLYIEKLKAEADVERLLKLNNNG